MKKNSFTRKTLIYALIVMILTMGFGLGTVSAFAAQSDEEESEYTYDDSYYSKYRGKNIEINVYNWGEYISDGEDDTIDVNAEFEELTGIKVNYLNYETNEAMYAKLKAGANAYDVIFPSDYMVSRLAKEGMIQPINFDNIPNMKYIDETLLHPSYDPDQLYSVPYAWSRVAIIYNTRMVTKEVTGWDILWDEDYAGQILMYKNSRDAFGVALMALGYDLNSEDKNELDEAAELLKKQKPLVQAYVMDQVFDKMQNNEAAIAAYYVGDFYLMYEINDELDYFIPDATELFVDNACIPSDATHKEAAEMYINFLNEPEIAAANAEYIMYSTPNLAAKELLDEETRDNPNMYPTQEDIENDHAFINLSDETNLYLDSLWTEILADDSSYNKWIMPLFIIVSIAVIIVSNVRRRRKKAKQKQMEEEFKAVGR